MKFLLLALKKENEEKKEHKTIKEESFHTTPSFLRDKEDPGTLPGFFLIIPSMEMMLYNHSTTSFHQLGNRTEQF